MSLESHALKNIWRDGKKIALDALLPPLCLACEAPLASAQALCGKCWQGTSFIAAPFCRHCGIPLQSMAADQTLAHELLCARCIEEPPIFDRARAALQYGDVSRTLILSFKHRDQLHAAPAMAEWMQRAIADIENNFDLIIPVPLHPLRLFLRRYNQAAILAHQLAKRLKKPVEHYLKRARKTPSQGHLSRKERAENVKGAFIISDQGLQRIKGNHILLVDDVLTTGATANECAKVLKVAGAAAVSVVTLARVGVDA